MDAWLEHLLIERGYLDPFTGGTRSARGAPCPKCQAPVVRGLDAEWCALSVDADPRPLTQWGELAAIMAKRSTYELTRHGDRLELDRRDQWRIKDRPAGGPGWRGDVLALHVCRAPHWPPAAYRPSRCAITPPALVGDAPPF